ncbi:MAG: hypothetical protein ACRDBG_13410 [Waterburya sp.]
MTTPIKAATIQRMVSRASLRCQSEAVAMGFEPEHGLHILQGCIEDDINRWSSEQYIEWCELTDKTFGRCDWLGLYREVSRILGEIAKQELGM